MGRGKNGVSDNELVAYDSSVDFAVGAWLHEKGNRTRSENTRRTYERIINDFRGKLRRVGTDLDGDTRSVALVLQAWCGDNGASPATANQRCAVVSSFYRYCQRHGLLGVTDNPAARVERRPEQRYRTAQPLSHEVLRRKLADIDRMTLAGKRDYALILVGLTTGRRLAEIRNITPKDIEASGESYIVTFPHAKGGKVMRDKLSQPVGRALRDYLLGLSQEGYALRVDEPIWLSLSKNASHGKPLSILSIEYVCERRIGTSRFHSLRHTFAHAMESAGAKVSDIQARLGHSNIATTGIYLASLRSDENEYVDELTKLFVGE